MQHASSSEGYVLSKVSSVAAQLMKRGWLEFTPAQKEVFFYQKFTWYFKIFLTVP
ncbi:unnamed protein product [Arabidopsis thaliana]|uniref:Uncharacterized protein n=1 Tax=Arabidopsis thaliana TaxID=3702 RepID=A0A5S9X961_ARATH|nr:unnamed protein product [Arabidopsis thaliana]